MPSHAHAPTARASTDEIRSLDLLVQRLQHLNGGIEVLTKTQQHQSPWTTIAHQTGIVSGRLGVLYDAYNAIRPLLRQAHTFPLPTFPGRTLEGMATQLTRKKMLPWAEDWVSEGVKYAVGLDNVGTSRGDAALSFGWKLAGDGGLTAEEIEWLWDWAGPAGGKIGRGVLSAQDEGDDEGEEDGAMEGVEDVNLENGADATAHNDNIMPLDQILRFICTGGSS